MTPEDFYSSLVTFNIQLSDTQKAQFKTYFEFLVSENEKINLTAITDKMKFISNIFTILLHRYYIM